MAPSNHQNSNAAEPASTDQLSVRRAEQADLPGISRLIDSVYREYGDYLRLDGVDSDLTDLDQHYYRPGGMFWVLADSDGRIWGTHAYVPIADRPGVCNFRRLYLDVSLRGGSWGSRLMQLTIDHARQAGQHRVEFWSDTRFHRAHRFFARFGFQTRAEMRTVDDGFSSFDEYFFWLDLHS